LLSHALGQRSIPYAPPERWKALQKKRVKWIVKHAYESVPFYRSYMAEKGLRPSDFNSVTDLHKLPVISKETLVKNPDSFLSTRYQKSQCLELRTGGTTGKPASIWHDRRSLILNIAYGERERAVVTQLLKMNFGYRVIGFAYSGSTLETVWQFYDSNLFLPRWAKPNRVIGSTANPLSTNLDLLNRCKPDILHTYGSYLGALFQYAIRHRKKIYKPKIAIYGADSLSEVDRQLIERDLQIPILSAYNACEALKIGFMCELGKGFHLHPDLCVVSLINEKGELVGPGECGEVVISNLINRAMVLLNYRLGDLAILNKRPCDCGRTFPLLQSLEGRKEDIIELPDGNIVHPRLVWNVFKKRRDVQRYQVVQRGPWSFAVKVLPVEGINMKTLEEELRREFDSLFGVQAQVDIVFVNAFPPTGPAKFRAVVSWGIEEDRKC